jgi:Zn-dependent protease with chaperone function
MSSFFSASPEKSTTVQPTGSFRLQVLKMMGSILLFFVTYGLLLVYAGILAAIFLWAGVSLIMFAPLHPITIFSVLLIIAGLGIIFMGIMQVLFLIKFLFTRQHQDLSLRIPVTRKEQPILFDCLQQIARATKTRFPKKVYLAPGVNAAVIYPVRFMNMFWPVGKKLEIGLGLVNSLNVSEFSMAIAHEFGHFSQRSMKLASYVYTVNRMIYNMLYENQSWHKTMSWISGRWIVFALLARINLRIVSDIQKALRLMYGMVNRQYMALRREMEFHADEVALKVAGTDAAISAMRRLEISGFFYEHCLLQLPEMARQQRRFGNIYEVHRSLIRLYATQHEIALDAHQLPLVTDNYFSSFLLSRVQLPDQWATHPSREEREQRYIAANINKTVRPESAWQLFQHAEELQERMSTLLNQQFIQPSGQYIPYPVENFIADTANRIKDYSMPAVFNEYYDNRPFPLLPDNNITPLPNEQMEALSITTLYAETNVQRLRAYFRDIQDADTLHAIQQGQIKTRYFEFEGRQYPTHAAGKVRGTLQAIIRKEAEWLESHDTLAIHYHYTVAFRKDPACAQQLLEHYFKLLEHQGICWQLNDIVARILHAVSTLFSEQGLTMAAAQICFDSLVDEGALLRKILLRMKHMPEVTGGWDGALQEKMSHFLRYNYSYVNGNEPVMEEIANLHEISTTVMEQYNNSIILMKKAWLEAVL